MSTPQVFPEHESALSPPKPDSEEAAIGKVSIEATISNDSTDEQQDNRDKLVSAVSESSDVLATARTTMTLFPDTLTLDREKLTITKRKFFGTAEIITMRIEDILNATLITGPLFASIKIVSRVMNTDRPSITCGLLWKKEALKIKRIIQGYVIALQREIDCSEMPKTELIHLLDSLGEDNHPNV